ncbi:MAG: CvpA family protein [Phycisphaerae bacterium]|nr:CvpA family protein [Phycisphaerae bacterium]
MPTIKPPPRVRADEYAVSPPAPRPKQTSFQAGSEFDAGSGGEFQFDRPRTGRPPILSTILLLVAGVGLFAYSIQQGVLLAQIAIPFMTLTTVHGLWRGGFRKFFMLPLVIVAFYLAFTYPDFADPAVKAVLGSSSNVVNGVITAATLGLTLVIASLVLGRVRMRHIATRPLLLLVDRVIGSGIGLAEGVFVALSICWVVVMVRPHTSLLRDHQDTLPGSFRHRVATMLVRLADDAETEPLGRVVRATNLIENTPALRDVIDELNSTGKVDLESLDPEMAQKLNELIPQMSGGEFDNLNQLIEKYKEANEARDKAYRQLPSLQDKKK